MDELKGTYCSAGRMQVGIRAQEVKELAGWVVEVRWLGEGDALFAVARCGSGSFDG